MKLKFKCFLQLSILGLFLLNQLTTFAQNKAYVDQQVKVLGSKAMWGRGYTKDGMKKASLYIEKEYQRLGLLPLFKSSFLQEFNFPVNTFPQKLALNVGGKKLITGQDFIIKSNSVGLKTTGVLKRKDSITWIDQANRLTVTLVPKLTWSVARTTVDETLIQAKQADFINSFSNEETYSIHIDQKLNPDFKAYNVGGWIKGHANPEEYLVITAHHDHLGGLGQKTYFPGANDNASGVAFMLSLAQYYKDNPPPFSVVFLAFAAEEAGLLGSKYYTENPAFELSKIKFLFNFDLMGNGDQGATIVNATVFPKQFETLNGINSKGNYLKSINSRGKAANSDHYHFSEKGVPAFFMYTQGGGPAYHDIDDKPQAIQFPVYEKIFELIKQFNQEVMKP